MKLAIVALLAQCVFAQSPDHWVSTWATSPQQPRAFPPRPAATTQAAASPAATAPASTATPTPAPPRPQPITSFHDQTLRMIAHTSIGGKRVRIELSNAFGSTPLLIGEAHIALRLKESAIVAASDRTLRFGGQPACWIPAGATVI